MHELRRLATVAYLGATILFILAPRRTVEPGDVAPRQPLRHRRHGDRRAGDRLRPAGDRAPGLPYILGAMVVGAAIGAVRRARRADDADARAGRADAQPRRPRGRAGRLSRNFIDPAVAARLTPAENTIHEIEIYVGVLIGAVTFSGSVIAFGKLSGKIGGKPLLLPARHWLNLAGLLSWRSCFGWRFVAIARLRRADDGAGRDDGRSRCCFGVHMVMAIGGADMPVVVSMLNSYSGWAAAATGFMLLERPADRRRRAGRHRPARSCRTSCAAAMNRIVPQRDRSAASAPTAARRRSPATRSQQARSSRSTRRRRAELLKDAKNVIIVPGYGMAVAQAQHAVNEITEGAARARRQRALRDPSGRRPHAGPHERAARRGEGAVRHRVRDGRASTTTSRDADVAMVIGANDIVNPAAQDDPTQPDLRHAGARGVEGEARRSSTSAAWPRATRASTIRCSTRTTTMMLFGDAKKMLDEVQAVEGLTSASVER